MKTVNVTLKLGDTSTIEVLPLTPKVREYIEENGLDTEMFESAYDKFQLDPAYFHCSSYNGETKAEIYVENEDGDAIVDKEKSAGMMFTTHLPKPSDELEYDYQESDSYDDEDEEAFDKFMATYHAHMTQDLDKEQKEVYNSLVEDELESFPFDAFKKEVEMNNNTDCEHLVMWITKGESYEFSFSFEIPDDEDFDENGLSLVTQSDWFDGGCDVVAEEMDMRDYVIMPQWLIYKDRLIRVDSSECCGFGCEEAKLLITDSDMECEESWEDIND